MLHWTIFLLLFPLQDGHSPSERYAYDVACAEWDGRSHGHTVTVVIRGDSIRVLHNGGPMSGKKGSVIDSGIIMKHVPTGQWIIGRHKRDADAKEVGGCTEGLP